METAARWVRLSWFGSASERQRVHVGGQTKVRRGGGCDESVFIYT